MKITTAWVMDETDVPWLISAYDEITFDEWGKVPDFHKDAIEKHSGLEVRELVMTVPDAAVFDLFATVEMKAEVCDG